MSTIEIEPSEEPPAQPRPTRHRSAYAVVSAIAVAALTVVTLVTLHDERTLADRAMTKAARPVPHVVVLSASGDGARLVMFVADGTIYPDPPLDTPIVASSVVEASVIVTAHDGQDADCMITVDGEPVDSQYASSPGGIAYCHWHNSVMSSLPRRYGDYLD